MFDRVHAGVALTKIAPSPLAGTIFADRYRVDGHLRDALGVHELIGSDLASGAPVVIGTIPVDAADTTGARLAGEIATLEATSDPHLAAATACGSADSVFYAVRPFVAGVALDDRLLEGPLDILEAVTAVRDVLEGLGALHAAGVLHLDVQSAAVTLHEGSAVLSYLGLARGVPLAGHRDLEAAAVRHLSPEQTGLIREEVGERSDLYSVGVLLFELLTGRPAFEGKTVNEVFRAQLAGRVPELGADHDDIPEPLRQVLGALMSVRPGDRYASTIDAASDLERVRRLLADGEPVVELAAAARRPTVLSTPRFVGRDVELATIAELLAAAEHGGGGLLLLDAESGGGKSALLAEAGAAAARDRGAWVLRGQGAVGVADRPYTALEGVIEAVRRRATEDQEFREHLQRELADHADQLAAAMPQLAGALGSDPQLHSADAGHGAALTRAALAALLDALGRPGAPALVVLDDVQWADELSIELIDEWATRPTGPGNRHVVTIAAYRTEEVPADHPLRAIAADGTIALRPLNGAELAQIVASMAGAVPGELIDIVVAASSGVPFMAVEMVRGLVETGALTPRGAGWELRRDRLDASQSTLRAAEIARGRIDQLPDDVLEVLMVAAVLGKQFAAQTVWELTGRREAEVTAALEEASARHIVWHDSGSRRWAFLHDKLRESLLERLPEERQRQLHLELAEQLRSRQHELAFELAYHFDVGGEPARAVPYALTAATDARRRYSLQIAERYYRIALRGADPADAVLLRAVHEGIGDTAMLRGDYAVAEEHLEAAFAVCDDADGRGVLEGKLGELAFKRGEIAMAAKRLEDALRGLGQRVPRTGLGLFVALLREVIVQIAHTLAPKLFLHRRSLAGADRELAAIRLHSKLAHAYWFGFGKVPCAWTHLRGMNLAERYPVTLELAQAYSEHAPVMTMIPYFSRGEDYARRSLAIRRDLGDVWGEGQSLHFLGVVLYGASRYEDALGSLRDAVELLERTGDQWEMSTARWHIAFCLSRLGQTAEAAEVAREVHRVATALGDVQAQGISLGAIAKATAGAAPARLVDDAVAALSTDVHTATEVLIADALRRLAAGDPGAAVVALDRADRLVRTAGLRQEYVAPVPSWLATALRAALADASPFDRRGRRALRRRLRRTTRRARRIAGAYRNNLPHALREQGLLAALTGRRRRAARLLRRSVAIAVEQGAALEATLSAHALAALAGSASAADPPLRLDPQVRRIHSLGPSGRTDPSGPVTLSLADRFSTVLDSGRAIAAALTRENVYAAVHEAAVALLRTDTCAIYARRDDGSIAHAAGAAGPLHSSGEDAARQALSTPAQVTMQQVSDDDASSLAATAGPRFLCAVIRGRDVAEACLVVPDPGAGLFGEEEERLAAYVATLAGAALENARGFAASEAQSRSLEQMVEDRTAQLHASNAEMASALSLLEATLESTADGILVVDGNGRIVSFNQRYAQMWRLPAEILDRGRDEGVMHWAVDQVVEPEAFAARVQEIYGDPEGSSYDVIEFTDGRVYERFSQPQRVNGEATARVWSFHDLTRQKRSERELERLANHDGLTGLMNRRRFEHELQRSIAELGRTPGSAAVLLLDVDNFKYINDTLGHGAGDELIKGVASLLQGRLRGTDVIARLGGDEFAILLRHTEEPDAYRVGVDLLSAIRRHKVAVGDQAVSVTASIGVTIVQEADLDVSQVLADADLAMYEVKRNGRDGVSVSAPERAREVREAARFTWAERLRVALEEDHFVLFAQPVLDLHTGEITRHEALLRLRGDDGEIVPPGHFLPTAERLGLIMAIDRWVVAHAIRDFAPWLGGRPDRAVEINLSGNSMGDPELPALIAEELARSGVDPRQLIFEVTETATIANMDDAKAFASSISQLGCQFALDDFGTGFGSFYYLKHLPVDYLKIDGDFISDLPDGDTDQLIVKSIVEIARGTGKRTIAEFVSDRQILRQVRELGVDYAQGYFIGKPVPVTEIAS